jgi:2-oxo-3-hexenedioate decarboxylase
MNVQVLADRVLAADAAAERLPLLSASDPGFNLDDAYAVANVIRTRRIDRGERPRGYKIGFTNRSIWARYGVYAPIWGPVWDSSLRLIGGTHASVSITGLVQPRLEPEIVFGFRAAPRAGMDEAELLACLDWVAHGFEIVHTHFDAWRFQAADTVADFALHGRLIVGPRVPVSRFDDLGPELAALQIELAQADVVRDRGQGKVVLDGPLTALRLWVAAMSSQAPAWTVAPGDVVTTGTLTDAWPLEAGQAWQTRLSDARLAGLRLDIVA